MLGGNKLVRSSVTARAVQPAPSRRCVAAWSAALLCRQLRVEAGQSGSLAFRYSDSHGTAQGIIISIGSNPTQFELEV